MRSKFTRPLGVLAVSAAMLALAACGGGSSDGESKGGDTSLKMAWANVPAQLDPMVYTGNTVVYATDATLSGLLEYDYSKASDNKVIATDELVPALAESFEPNEDRTQFTFKLRKGVKSQYGNELTADDVVWTFERFASNPTSIQANSLMGPANVDAKNAVEKIDDYTIRYNLSAPSSISLSILAYPLMGILDSTEVKKHATADDPYAGKWLATNSAGFGPYMLESLKPGEEIKLKQNPNYWDKKPYFKDILIKNVPDGAARAQLLMAGEVDLISEPPIDQLKKIESNDATKVNVQPDTNRHNFNLSMKDPDLKKPEVRKAINMAIDRESIASSIYQGYAKAAWTPVPSNMLADQEPMIEYNPDEAKKLLADAGYADGLDFEISISSERPGPYAENIARLIQSDLKKIGVTVSIKNIPSPADFEQAVTAQSMQAYLYSDRPSQPDPGFSMFLYNASKSALNKVGFANPEFDALVAGTLKLDKGEERDAIIEDALQMLRDNQPIFSLVEMPDITGEASDLGGRISVPSGGYSYSSLTRE
ncbi:ABC transporter substrate-binding protein [Aeromicrobium wangtongii]|uniref:ABC transporter substrate-binding protein n=1 Tax=Aeromicrobium wangtongii TaxID=2969247 RepID=A0ABY5M515_9ACTN|nr:ABC transporter substrate-binding protein [Aeromicrobium wangtongii]MCD9198689.1 ABC transporter substrate-binding protein [Aeromicrobium wangtongii]MCL3819601.1 ABC transporter substrate-binding protein [Aeromicrobium wangtongii]UUP13265.1 ABC transporter substrate-binding protein [Aeromicrobium wangtongii]